MLEFVFYGQFIGQVQDYHRDGSVTAWFHDSIGGAGYLLRLWDGEWQMTQPALQQASGTLTARRPPGNLPGEYPRNHRRRRSSSA